MRCCSVMSMPALPVFILVTGGGSRNIFAIARPNRYCVCLIEHIFVHD